MATRLLHAIARMACRVQRPQDAAYLARLSVRGVRKAVPEVENVAAVEARFTAVTTVFVDQCG